jgi:isopentenyl phosphate kinase
MILVKLGGSVITDKSRLRTFKKESVSRLAGEIARAGKQVILVHGAGSYGHVIADKYQLQHGFLEGRQLEGLGKVMQDVRDLNAKVMKALSSKGINAASIPPSVVAELDNGALVRFDLQVFERYLELCVTPVTFGDVALDRSRRFGICSGDQLMERLAEHFRPESVIFCTDVDGVFSSDPNTDPKARLIEEVDRSVLDLLPKKSKYVDVTGSIHGKIECILRMSSNCDNCIVLNGNVKGRLESALKGKRVKGSRIVGG